jgi:hypothetical protein
MRHYERRGQERKDRKQDEHGLQDGEPAEGVTKGADGEKKSGNGGRKRGAAFVL